jgi:hypothetical protein
MDGRIVWRLFSPSFRLISCELSEHDGRFRLCVANGEEVLAFCEAGEFETLHARAAEWRAQLEARGYQPSGSVRAADAPSGRRCETRTAFLGLLECAAVLELQCPDLARQLRDRATEGLVAVGLSDPDLILSTVASSRELLANAASPEPDPSLIRSCIALLDRVEAMTPQR